MIRTLSFLTFALALSGCAALQQEYEARTCHYDGAYERGANEARQGEDMNGERVAMQCPEASRADVRRGYREGYVAVKNEPRSTPLVVVNTGGRYGRERTCKEAYGRKQCGYDCKEAFGQIKCAQNPEHNCIEAYGKIQCGLNCREEYGQVKCDRTEG